MRPSFLPSTAPATPTLQALVNELTSVEDWHLLGVNLGLQGHQLHEIERNYRGDSNRCKTETLYLWQRNAKDPSWEAIVKGLCLMQEHVVADRIRRKYCCSSTTAGKATPSGDPVSGQGLSQVKRWAGGFSHYVIIPLSEHDHKDSCCRTVIYTFSNKGINIV